MYSTSSTVTNRPLGKEWSENVANISVEPIFLVKRGDAAICEREGRSVGDSNLKFYVVVAGLLDGFMLNVGSSQPSYIGNINL